MKTITSLLLCLLASTAAADYKHRWLPNCDTSTIESRASFTLQCINNANPKSDEEPEDWIRVCKDMAEETYCPMAMFRVYSDCGGCAKRKIVIATDSDDPNEQ